MNVHSSRLRLALFLLVLLRAPLGMAQEGVQEIDDWRDPFRFHHEMTVNRFLDADGFGARRIFDSVPGLHGALNADDGPWLDGDALKKQRKALPSVRRDPHGGADPMHWEMKVEPIRRSRIPVGR